MIERFLLYFKFYHSWSLINYFLKSCEDNTKETRSVLKIEISKLRGRPEYSPTRFFLKIYKVYAEYWINKVLKHYLIIYECRKQNNFFLKNMAILFIIQLLILLIRQFCLSNKVVCDQYACMMTRIAVEISTFLNTKMYIWYVYNNKHTWV